MARIRPPGGYQIYLDRNPPPYVLHCLERVFELDHVFTDEANNAEVFERVGEELVTNTLAGINNTIMVYGHTGSGKTFTMAGGLGEEGIIQMSVKLLRRRL